MASKRKRNPKRAWLASGGSRSLLRSLGNKVKHALFHETINEKPGAYKNHLRKAAHKNKAWL